MARIMSLQTSLTAHSSIGASLVDTLDDLINDGYIEPQLAMKILGHFDRLVAEVLVEKVRARMTFKVGPQARSEAIMGKS